jgi:Fe-S-cluster-containing hydrogenase component 2
MMELQDAVSGDPKKDPSPGEIIDLIYKFISRRDFLVGSGMGVTSFCIMGYATGSGAAGGPASSSARQVYVANALGMVVADSTLCVGCRRCESACVAYNDGIVQPSIARVKVGRNINFGVAGVSQGGFQRGDGDFGNFRTVQDTCRQCPHPVPCQLACPHDAIEVLAPTNARVVNAAKCQVCGICVAACPWAMTSLTGAVNGSKTKATKCTLCNGNPKCVRACPAGALKYTSWSDRTREVPARQVVTASIRLPADVKDTCSGCH